MKPKAVTLVELMMVIALFGVIVLGAIAFDGASRRFLGIADRRTQAINEASLCLEYVSKTALTAIGDLDNLAFQIQGGRLVIRNDSTADGIWNAANDNFVSYGRTGTNFQRCLVANAVGACPGGGWETISRRVTAFNIVLDAVNRNVATVTVTATVPSPGGIVPAEVVTVESIIETPAQSIQ